ncbi:MAG: alanine--tRNA ligase, partial [Alphaproteobacteria bacterium]|nr:alanine--tRNA ligase [Alphaproteobacteria bacterium]
MNTTNEIRQAFLEFFEREGHEVVSSSPLVPRNDPTLLFTNAGMVQFKNVFTGIEKRDYSRAATSQKCVRAGGKHNDLENVGYTARHHTFFEMLGNFSFGDYFKDVAIENAWKLITQDYGLSKDRLLVTVYSEDEEAARLWKQIAGLDDNKIIRISTSDNFWSMGDTGPCGPCSEIFFDHGEAIKGGPPGSPDEDGDRYVEIWNLVFMQFEQIAQGERVDLPRPSIDTGMGLERISAILQGKHDNYDIDLMRGLIEASAKESNVEPDGPYFVSHRVIADHLRASAFLIADGILPSNEGRGYVLRRIMRRAMRHAHLIGCEEPLMWKLVPALITQMGEAFNELKRAESLTVETFKLEETKFKETLGRGLRQLEDVAGNLSDGSELPGELAFKLYDTYGFPLDLTQDIMRGKGRGVDLNGFNNAMEAQKASARAAWSGSGEASTDELWFDIKQNIGATEFLGYSTEYAEGQVLGLVVNGEETDKIEPTNQGDAVILLLNQTPFYGESGGQMGDHGRIVSSNGAIVDVTDVKKKVDDLFLHIGKIKHGKIEVGEFVELHVDSERRNRLKANHSATHLMHEALRRHLGLHVTQKGSQVAEQRLRFDFNHSSRVTDADLKLVESAVNYQIRNNTNVSTRIMDPESAIESGAMALFGE